MVRHPDLIAVAASGARAESVAGIPRIIDGDTLELGQSRIRLHGIDAPEAGQPHGRDAINGLAELTEGKQLRCEGNERDDFGRLIATCFEGSTEINAVMVASGRAWAFVKYSSLYRNLEQQTRAARAGIWRNASKLPQPPWEYRAAHWQVAKQAAPTGCPIKGNITSKGEHIYHAPWSPWYAKTSVEEGHGEQWFCSEREAVAAGWRAPYWR